jgi:hypothetical protein
MRVDVCARSAVCEAPEIGARDQYMPLAGAGCTSGAVFRSGKGGKEVCGPRGGRGAGVVLSGGAGEAAPAGVGFAAIADVERRFRGRLESGEEERDAGGLATAGERVCSDAGG